MSKLLLLVVLAIAAWVLWRGTMKRRASMTTDEARAVLGLEPTADAAEVHAAYRRLSARVHPDVGGSSELARRVKGARDILIADLNRAPVTKS